MCDLKPGPVTPDAFLSEPLLHCPKMFLNLCALKPSLSQIGADATEGTVRVRLISGPDT